MSQANDFERDIHRRLLAGDPIAPSQLADAYLETVIKGVGRRSGGRCDPTLIEEAAIDAVLDYVGRPERFNPDRQNLLTYLVMAGRGDLLNALDRERRVNRHLEPLEIVADSGDGRNSLQERAGLAYYDEYELGDELPFDVSAAVEAAFPDPADRKLVELIANGERRTDVYAEVLGVQDREKPERERIVKQHKDRVKKRLTRLKDKIRGQET